MADEERRTLLNKRLLAEARRGGDIEELLTSLEFRDAKYEDEFQFDINCTDLSGNTPLHLAVLSGLADNVDLLIESCGCDVDLQNNAGDTPLHLAVKVEDAKTRYEIVYALVVVAGATDSIRLANKAGQTPNVLANIYFPNDTEVNSLTTAPAREMTAILEDDDFASDGEDGSGSE